MIKAAKEDVIQIWPTFPKEVDKWFTNLDNMVSNNLFKMDFNLNSFLIEEFK